MHNPELVLGVLEDDEDGMSKTLYDSKYVYFQDDFKDKTKVTNAKSGIDELTLEAISLADVSLGKLDGTKNKAVIYMAYEYVEPTENINKAVEDRATLEKRRLAEKFKISNVNLLMVVTTRYTTSTTGAYREFFYPTDGLDEKCVKNVTDYIKSTSRKKFTDGMDDALKDRAQKLNEFLKDCKVTEDENAEGKNRAEIAKRYDNDDVRLYNLVIEADGRLTDSYVDCAEFVYDVLKEQGYTGLPSGGCVEQEKWYSDQKFDFGTDASNAKVGDVLLWDNPKRDLEYNHTAIVVEAVNGQPFRVIHAGLNGCRCYDITYRKANDFKTAKECFDSKCLYNYSISSPGLGYFDTTGKSTDGLIFKKWIRIKKSG